MTDLAAARSSLLGALKRRHVIVGGKAPFSMEEAVREALAEFEALPEFQALDEMALELPEDAQALHELEREYIRRLFLRSVLTGIVASQNNPERAVAIGRVVDRAMAIILAPKPKPTLRLVT